MTTATAPTRTHSKHWQDDVSEALGKASALCHICRVHVNGELGEEQKVGNERSVVQVLERIARHLRTASDLTPKGASPLASAVATALAQAEAINITCIRESDPERVCLHFCDEVMDWALWSLTDDIEAARELLIALV